MTLQDDADAGGHLVPPALGAWEAGTWAGWTTAERQLAGAWMRSRGIYTAAQIRRIEFYSGPFALVRRYARDAHGFKYQDPATGEPATEPPALVALDELPPARLLGSAGE